MPSVFMMDDIQRLRVGRPPYIFVATSTTQKLAA
jgi:hypothetical protein